MLFDPEAVNATGPVVLFPVFSEGDLTTGGALPIRFRPCHYQNLYESLSYKLIIDLLEHRPSPADLGINDGTEVEPSGTLL